MMRKYRNNADSPVRTDYGIALLAGLGFFTETQGFAASFKTVNDELYAAHTARRAARKPLLEKRAAFRFAHYNTDQTIKMAHKAAQIADGGSRGQLSDALFPDGLGPVIAPYGTRQIKPTEELISRISNCKLPSAEAYRAEWKPKLEAALTKLTSTGKDVETARDAYLNAFRAEVALRAEHYYSVDKLMGLVRSAFPGDRAKQDLVFPVIEDSDGGGEEDEEAEGGQPAPGNAPEAGGTPS
jgi:hypothetical protein